MKSKSEIGNCLFRGIIVVMMITIMMANFASLAHAMPQPPNWFYGNVTINGIPAPTGTIVSARIGGVEYESGFVDDQGRYGYDEGNPFRVPADDPGTQEKEGGVEDELIAFYVAGLFAISVPFHVGVFTELDLHVTSTMEAELSINEVQDFDGVVTIPVNVSRIKDSVTGETITGISIRCYVASAFYNPAGIEMLTVRYVPPFCNPTILIYPPEGRVDFWVCTPGEGVEPPFTLGKLVPRLIGCATNSYDLEVVLAVNHEPGGPTIPGARQMITFQRGDANGDGVVNIIDAMFGAQYLVGLRPVQDIRPLNMASVHHNGSNGDVKNIIDCMYIAQYVVGIRDCYFEVVP